MRPRARISRDTRAALIALALAVGCDGDCTTGSRDVFVRDAILGSDGTVILVGQTSVIDAPGVPDGGTSADAGTPLPGDAWIARASGDDGSPIWQKAIGTTGVETVETVIELATGQIIAVGSATGPTDVDGWIVGLEPGGALDFQVLLSGPGEQRLYDALEVLPGIFVVAGIGVDTTGAPGLLVARFGIVNDGGSRSAVTEWQTLLALPVGSRAGCATRAPSTTMTAPCTTPIVLGRPDGTIVVVASSDFAYDDDADGAPDGPEVLLMARLSADGELVAQTALGPGMDIVVEDALLVDDGTALLATGEVVRPAREPDPPDALVIPDTDLWIAKATLDGTVTFWNELVQPQGIEVANRLVRRRAVGYALLATADGFGTRQPLDTDLWWIELDTEGASIVDQRALTANDPQSPIAAFELPSADLFVVGTAVDRTARYQAIFWTLYADSLRTSATGCGQLGTTRVMSIPTPAGPRDLAASEVDSTLELLALPMVETAVPPPLTDPICDPGS
jgi:hypothetical protein